MKPRPWHAALLVTLQVTLTMAALDRQALAQNFSAEELARRTVERRAIEAINWGMPAVNYDLMLQAAIKAGAGPNQVVYWSRPLGWKNQTLTPNPDTIYFMPFYDTTDGPVVLEIPPADEGSITGSVDDAWQTAIEDVGPVGVDTGKGGKYLILPPGYEGRVPDGYIHMPSSTHQGFALLRSTLESATAADIAKAVAYGKRIKLYPLARTSQPPETKFVDAIDAVFDATIPYDMRFFEALDRFVQREVWLVRDKAMIDTLKSLGIEKGKTFQPDAKTKAILEAAAQEARAWLDARYEALYATPYYDGAHWALPAPPAVIEGLQTNFAKPDVYPVDGRGVLYYFVFSSIKHLGTGQYYLMTTKDKDGKSLDGGSTYRITVPANVPVNLYWSATAYDRATHALIRDTPRSSRGSNSPDLAKNADGSVDVYFGPNAPAGKESNWVPTKAGGALEVAFRFYGPEKPLFDKTWKLPDIEKIK